MEKLIITAAVTGGDVVSKRLTPHVPCTIDEIVEEVYKSWEAGASIVHLHAKDPKTGSPASDPNPVLREYIRGIRARCDIIINVTTGGGRRVPEEKLDEVIRERCGFGQEMSSLNMGTINFWVPPYMGYFSNTVQRIERWAGFMQEKGVKPELEVYDTGMINTALSLAQKGSLKEPLHFQFVMIGGTGISPTPKGLLYCVESIPENYTWSVCALGRYEMAMAAMAIVLGGHVRVGMEDNIYLSRGILAKSNAELVSKAVRIAKELGREIATPDEAREILNLAT